MHPLLFVLSSCMSLLTDERKIVHANPANLFFFFSLKMSEVNTYLTQSFTRPLFKVSLESLIFMLKSGQ